MGFYKFIKIKGMDGNRVGHMVPNLYKLHFCWRELRNVGLRFVKERLTGCSIWYVTNKTDYQQAINTLNELKKTHIFKYKVSNW